VGCFVVDGRVYQTQSKTDWALKNYLDAVELGETDPLIIRQTLRLLFEKQRYADADRLLRQLQRQQLPFSPDMTASARSSRCIRESSSVRWRLHGKPLLERRTIKTTYG